MLNFLSGKASILFPIILFFLINPFRLFGVGEISFTAGFISGINSDDFFSIYRSELINGPASSFICSPLLKIGAKYPFGKNFRFGFELEYFLARINDSYNQDIPNGSGKRNISQKININTIPVIAALEIIPNNVQFRTYCGLGLGALVGKITWFENVRSDSPNDIRTGGTHFDKIIISPVVKIYCGIELGFDDKQKKNVVGSVIIETAFVYSNRNAEIFRDIALQFNNPPDEWNKSVPLIPVFLSFNLGLSFYSNRVL